MKIPSVYEVAAELLRKHIENKSSLKSLIYKSNFENLKQLFALLHEVVKNASKLEFLLGSSGLQVEDYDPYLTKLLLYDIVLKGRRVASSHPLVKMITKEKKKLLSLLEGFVQPVCQSLVEVPRYVRVNTIKMTVSEASKALQSDGWSLRETPEDYDAFLQEVRQLQEDQYLIDYHLEYLLVFNAKVDFHDHEFVKNGSFLLQDKASCLSAAALNPKGGSKVIDSCAAPGMKTTLLAALMENTGSIVAIDRNRERSSLLQSIVNITGATCVEVHTCDFLKLSPHDYPDVKYILVDPSCSGSGIARRTGYHSEKDESRLKKLANFQSVILKHALQFPSVKRVVYSTCSEHKEENECVVEDVLKTEGGKFKVKTVLKGWRTRGLQGFSFGSKCVRASPDQDLTNGFFIAGFVRRRDSE